MYFLFFMFYRVIVCVYVGEGDRTQARWLEFIVSLDDRASPVSTKMLDKDTDAVLLFFNSLCVLSFPHLILFIKAVLVEKTALASRTMFFDFRR